MNTSTKGRYSIRMPDIGEGIAEVELVKWHVAVGDAVTEDQPLADVMTDKANVEIPSPVAGVVSVLGGAPGDVIAVGAELIRLEVEGSGNQRPQDASEPLAAPPAAGDARAAADAEDADPQPLRRMPAPHPADTDPTRPANAVRAPAPAAPAPAAPTRSPRASMAPVAPVTPRAPGEKPFASPAVRRRAWDLGIELQFVQGSGPAGRITQQDLDAHVQSAGQPPATLRGRGFQTLHGEEAIPVVGLRRRIAQKMQESKRRIPHFSYVEEIDVTDIEALRARLNTTYADERGKLTLLPLLARAVVITLRDFPQINARFDDDEGVIRRSHPVHLGIATQTDAGLLVPVVRHAEALDMWAIGQEVARLADVCRAGKATRDELSGSTITITSLGPLGGIVTTPVINHPEVAIVGVNRIVERPVIRDGQVVTRKLMNLSSSFDHRVVDGMDAARFIQAIRGLLETPALLFVD